MTSTPGLPATLRPTARHHRLRWRNPAPVITRGVLLFVTAFLRSYGHPQREWRRSAFDRSRMRRFYRSRIAETFLMAYRRSLRVGLRRPGNITGAEVVKSHPQILPQSGTILIRPVAIAATGVTWFTVALWRQYRHRTPPHHARLVTTWRVDRLTGALPSPFLSSKVGQQKGSGPHGPCFPHHRMGHGIVRLAEAPASLPSVPRRARVSAVDWPAAPTGTRSETNRRRTESRKN
jgi:hypothetical protein